MPRLSLRTKLLALTIVIALIPLGVAGWNMITITQDELKSAANDELSVTAGQMTREIDANYKDVWLGPLLLIANAVDNEELDIPGKIAILTSTNDIPDIVSLQLTLQGFPEPVVIMKQDYMARLDSAGLVAGEVLRTPEEVLFEAAKGSIVVNSEARYIKEINGWVFNLIIPLRNLITGKKAIISATISLDRLENSIRKNPFQKTGTIFIADENGTKLLSGPPEDLKKLSIVQSASELLKAGNNVLTVKPYVRPDGTAMLGAFSMPAAFRWAVITEKSEENAYAAVGKMQNSLFLWVFIGLILAAISAVIFAATISKPILEIGEVAQVVGTGNFNTRVKNLKSNDEISDLGHRFNEMIQGLRERFELMKFVSGTTIDAIKSAKDAGIQLGGERQEVTVFFSDIRGFTAFSEKVEPEVVIEMLNTYLRSQANIVKKYNGDIDKFVGDELVAVFKGDRMVERAILAGLEINNAINDLNRNHPEWNIGIGIGINSGTVIVGAMGSEERMDYTILGDNVNLGARLCSAAKRDQLIISHNSFTAITNPDEFIIEPVEPIMVKGKADPIKIYQVTGLKIS